eukprot:Skav234027  [mRNA]  locus=scaffold1723:19003:22190:+ [translate_table: standard]
MELSIRLVSVSDLRFDYDEVVLKSIDLELRGGRCLGLVGLNASGKTTLARLLRGQLRPKAGRIQYGDGVAPAPRKGLIGGTALAIVVAVLAAMIHLFLDGGPGRWAALALGAAASVVLLWTFSTGSAPSQNLVLHLSSETSDKDVIKPNRTIESVIGDELPKMSSDERRQQVIKMLQAGGFQMYNQETGDPVGNPMEYIRDGLRFGKLLHQIHIMADDLAFLQDGVICELGPAAEVLQTPKHPATKDYVAQFRGLPGGHQLGGKLAESYARVLGDEHLKAWIQR